jgi:hypothetical protein
MTSAVEESTCSPTNEFLPLEYVYDEAAPKWM